MVGTTTLSHRASYTYRQSRITKITECNYELGTDAEVCLDPTTIQWRSISDASYNFEGEGSGSWVGHDYGNENTILADFNGDGLTDLGSWTGTALSSSMKICLAEKGGFADCLSVGSHAYGAAKNIVGDFNGDGMADLIGFAKNSTNSEWTLYVSRGTYFSYQSKVSMDPQDRTRSGDFNGDGRTDLIDTSDVCLSTFNETTDRTEFDCSPAPHGEYTNSNSIIADFNGDGMDDVIGDAGGGNWDVYLSTGSGFRHVGQWQGHPHGVARTKVGDFNGDGLADIAGHNPGMVSRDHWDVSLSTGASFTTPRMWVGPDNRDHTQTRVGDFNGDGKTDMLGKIEDSDRWYVSLSDGSNFRQKTWDGHSGTLSDNRIGDFNGDGADDIMAYRVWASDWDVSLSDALVTDILAGVTDGNGHSQSIEYAYTADPTVYEKGSDADYPVLDVGASMRVVKKLTIDDGVGGENTISYKYFGQKYDYYNRASLGFSAVEITNELTGLVKTTSYSQNNRNYTLGIPLSIESKMGEVILSETINTPAVKVIGQTSTIPGRFFPYIASSVTTEGDLNEAVYGTVAKVKTYNDSGDMTREVITTTNGSDRFVHTTETGINIVTVNGWDRSLPHTITNTMSQTVAGVSRTDQRVATFQYNHPQRLLTKETAFFGTGKELVTDYEYNSLGQREEVKTSGPNISTRTTTETHDSIGRPKIVTNDLGHTTTKYYNDPRFDIPTEIEGANGLRLVSEFDAFGRTTKVRHPDGTQTLTVRKKCGINNILICASNEAHYVTTQTTGGVSTRVYFDKLDREVQTTSKIMGGRKVIVKTKYNERGLVASITEPHVSYLSDPLRSLYKTITEYDDLGRLLKVVHPDDSVSKQSYDGNSITSINALGQKKVRTKNAIGQLIKVEDKVEGEAGDVTTNTIKFEYDPFGNQTNMTDGEGTTVITVYDAIGQKESLDDPDKGFWKYTYNQYGELIDQTDAKGQVTFIDYDTLGRITARTDDFLGTQSITVWTYDTAESGRGKLDNITGPNGYEEDYSYDTLGRVTETTTFVGDDDYTTTAEYDLLGRPSGLTYPNGLRVKNVYDELGYLTEIRRADGVFDIAFWRAEKMDLRGNITEFRYGNQYQNTRSHKPSTGRIQEITSTPTGGSTQLHHKYTFDSVGNLKSRRDVVLDNTETMEYDHLNRLTEVEATGLTTQFYSYDNNGNIKSKTGVGTYAYDGSCNAGPHAVTGITSPHSASYCYDLNGNMITGGGRTISYNAFDKPANIVRASASIGMTYGPNRALLQRFDKTSGFTHTTTTFIGGLYEKVEHSDGSVTHKSYVGDFAVVIKEVGVEKTHYLHRDHLGSVLMVTDAIGETVGNYSFDPWGKRRDSDWSDLDLYLFVTPETTNKGFTGHEQMDSVGLIHMGGRVYDPIIGRFISADPFIQDVTNMQAWNRYSYVLNNPLSYTDPSGFFFSKLKSAIKKLGRGLEKAIKAPFRVYNRLRLSIKHEFDRLLARYEWFSQVVAVGMNFIPGAGFALSAAFSAYMTNLAGGNFRDFARGMATGALTGALGSSLGKGIGGNFKVGKMNFSVGGIIASGSISKFTGGNFGRGVLGYVQSISIEATFNVLLRGDAGGGSGSAKAQLSSPDCATSQPIDIYTGNKFLDIVDVKSGRLTFVRHYNSSYDERSSMGYGWRHNFERQLALKGSDEYRYEVKAQLANGKSIAFYRDPAKEKITGEDQWQAEKGQVEQLHRQDDLWLLTLANDTVETYNNQGQLIRIQSRDGYSQTLHYNDKKQLVSVVDSEKRQLQLAYDYRGLLDEVIAPNGARYEYRYQFGSVLRLVKSPNNSVASETQLTVKYLYQDDRFPHALTGLIDEAGIRYGTWQYDHQSRGIYEHISGLEENTLAYHSNHSTTVTNPLGKNTTYTFNADGKPINVEGHATASCIGANSGYSYDDNGSIASKTDWNTNRTEYRHNARGLEVSRTHLAGTDEAYDVTTQWHPQYQLPIRVTEPGKFTEYHYDQSGQLTQVMEQNTLTPQTAPRGWQYNYNKDNKLVAVDGPRFDVNDQIHFEYDEQGNRVRIINALNQVSEILAHNTDGLPTHIRAANGLETTLQYNSRGWLIEQTLLNADSTEPNARKATTRYQYSPIISYQGEGLIESVTLANGQSLQYEYNAARRVTAISNSLGERIEYTLDLAGNPIEERIKSADGTIVKQQQRVFDELNRLLVIVDAHGNRQSMAYDPNDNLIEVTDAQGRINQRAYDGLNRLITSTDALGGVTETHYNAIGSVAKVVDPRGIVTQYEYNGYGEVVKRISQDTGITLYDYDLAGNRIAKTDARGVTTQYHYDPLNRVTTIAFVNDEHSEIAATDSIHYHYDQHGAIGQLTQIQDQTGTTHRLYDNQNNIIKETHLMGDQHYITAYEYDQANQLIATTYPSGQRISYQRDSLNRISGIDRVTGDRIKSDRLKGEAAQSLLTAIRYNPLGPIAEIEFGNGITQDKVYDLDYRLTDIAVANDEHYQQQDHYDYDLSGNIVSITSALDASRSKRYDYDALNRLTVSANGTGSQQIKEQFSYDAVGNRVSYQRVANGQWIEEAYQYESNSNRLLQIDRQSENAHQARRLAYDATGSAVHDTRFDGTKRALQYGQNNRLIAVSDDYHTLADYQYNAKGQRVIKQDGEKTTHFLYDTTDRLIAEIDVLSNEMREYVYLDQERIATVAANDEVFYHHNDHLMTAQWLSDEEGEVVWQGASLAFGETEMLLAMVDHRFGFPGQYRDMETGYSYNYFRDYDASTGRYIQSDPIGLGGGVNTFGYTFGNPVRFTDPEGKAPPLLAAYGSFLYTNLPGASLSASVTFGSNYQQHGWAGASGRAAINFVAAIHIPGGNGLWMNTKRVVMSTAVQQGTLNVLFDIPLDLYAGTSAVLASVPGFYASRAAGGIFGPTAGMVVGESMSTVITEGFSSDRKTYLEDKYQMCLQ